jgi:hydrogenase maturation protease
MEGYYSQPAQIGNQPSTQRPASLPQIPFFPRHLNRLQEIGPTGKFPGHPPRQSVLSLDRQGANHSTSQAGRAKPVSKRILILGIGNVLWADEGFGVRCVEAMADSHALPPDVRLLDGGTQGLYLLPFLEDCDALLVFDAIDYGLPPGTLKLVRDTEVPAFMGAKKMSLHQTGFQDVIATAELMGYRPPEMALIGCQPVELDDYGGGLRPLIAARIPQALAMARGILAEWGVTVAPGTTASDLLADPSIRHQAYESGRPPADAACRTGDDRFFPLAL